jgi:ketosteroid isomerase-like protein
MTASTTPFRAAVEARDVEAMTAALAPDVVFHSPFAFTPFAGRETVGELLAAVIEAFDDDFHYTDELVDGDTAALVFRARVNGKDVQGLDLVRHDADGLISEFTVMLRPASGLMAMGEAMAPTAERLKARS